MAEVNVLTNTTKKRNKKPASAPRKAKPRKAKANTAANAIKPRTRSVRKKKRQTTGSAAATRPGARNMSMTVTRKGKKPRRRTTTVKYVRRNTTRRASGVREGMQTIAFSMLGFLIMRIVGSGIAMFSTTLGGGWMGRMLNTGLQAAALATIYFMANRAKGVSAPLKQGLLIGGGTAVGLEFAGNVVAMIAPANTNNPASQILPSVFPDVSPFRSISSGAYDGSPGGNSIADRVLASGGMVYTGGEDDSAEEFVGQLKADGQGWVYDQSSGYMVDTMNGACYNSGNSYVGQMTDVYGVHVAGMIIDAASSDVLLADGDDSDGYVISSDGDDSDGDDDSDGYVISSDGDDSDGDDDDGDDYDDGSY